MPSRVWGLPPRTDRLTLERESVCGGMDNATGRANPTAVSNETGAPQFLQCLGDEGRHFVVRIRFFGRAGKK